jgi:Zn-dependent peptidase ImmA (M78 family)/DNA-binding XRE family transcriptional regulator
MSGDSRFNPSRLTLARKRRGLTMTRLAELIGVEPRSISAYESGEFTPDPERRALLARVLQFPVTFFAGDDLEHLSPDIASFRAMSRMTASKRDMALGAGTIALLLNDWIEERFELPEASLPELSKEGGPEPAAAAIRHLWGLGELPVKNMIHLLESRGVRVFSLAIDAKEVDAFSVWHDRRPFMFLNTMKSAEHSRFDAAHELGHLVLHRHGEPQGHEAEREAHAFAAAFLMPRGSILAHARKFATVDHLVKLKKYWTVSVAALAYRLHAVGVLSEWHYRRLYIDISRRGYRTHELEEASPETSQVLATVFAALRDDSVAKKDIARQLHITPHEIEQIVFGLTLTSPAGGSGVGVIAGKRRGQLDVVSSRREKREGRRGVRPLSVPAPQV